MNIGSLPKSIVAHSSTNEVSVSVIIPVFNGSETIAQCLRAIAESQLQSLEVIVVDDGSDDDSAAIAHKFGCQVIRHKMRLGRNQARIRGFRAARAPIVINIDSDIVIRPNTIRKIKDFLEVNSGVAAVSGRLAEVHQNSNFVSQYKNLNLHYLYSRLPLHIPFIYGGIFGLRREVIGLLESNVDVSDDTDIGFNLTAKGFSVCLLPELEVEHLKSYTWASLIWSEICIARDWIQISRGKSISFFLNDGVTSRHLIRHFCSPKFIFFLKRIRGLRFALAAAATSIIQSFALLSGLVWGALQYRGHSARNALKVAR